ncbi:MAG: alpha/beta hydrolase [Acidimicrobiia bacterium]|nr:alpha/beta hydrolase [Acidimicrobiia bacterium]NNL27159.1 alpha/beta hydrolase [Acidimicrobiia bacterium]
MHTAMLEYVTFSDGPVGTLALLHATGFCKEVWKPVVEDLRGMSVEHDIVLWDQPGHGESPPGPEPVDWWDSATASLAVVGGRGEPVIGIGHSSGGAALAMAEILQPGTFAALLLFEPIIFPPPYLPYEQGLYSATLARRSEFESQEDALEHLRDRGAFRSWDERALRAYVDGALVDVDGRSHLRCAPATEASYYRSAGLHEAWERLGEISIPVRLVAGQHSDTHDVAFLGAQADRFSNASWNVVPDVGHLFPMENPLATARIIADFI